MFQEQPDRIYFSFNYIRDCNYFKYVSDDLLTLDYVDLSCGGRLICLFIKKYWLQWIVHRWMIQLSLM